ncbi:MAG: hypothetical protein ACP5NV_06335 [Candidatus Woesearchaeota archaeon]
MKKLIVVVLMIFALAFSVSAWHCADTDEDQPPMVNWQYGEWGDDGLLGGTSNGYLDKNVQLPEGCTGTKIMLTQGKFYYKDVVCEDRCDGTTLIEYYCDDRPRFATETIIKWDTYQDSNECGEEVPEFGMLAAGAAVIGALAIFAFIRKN